MSKDMKDNESTPEAYRDAQYVQHAYWDNTAECVRVLGSPVLVERIDGQVIHCAGGVRYTTACCVPCNREL